MASSQQSSAMPAAAGPRGTVVRKRRQGPAGFNTGTPTGGAAGATTTRAGYGGSTATMMRNYSDEAQGLKVDPVTVLVGSLIFIASVFMLHIMSKFI